MNTELTALTRPRISSGVATCTRVCRTTTLTMSKPPVATRASMDSGKLRERPNSTVVAPKAPTAQIIKRPARLWIGQRDSTKPTARAPMAGALLSAPRPMGPECRMSRAKMGRSEVTPARITANRSRVIAPSRIGLDFT